jgi:hypothetical protein
VKKRGTEIGCKKGASEPSGRGAGARVHPGWESSGGRRARRAPVGAAGPTAGTGKPGSEGEGESTPPRSAFRTLRTLRIPSRLRARPSPGGGE